MSDLRKYFVHTQPQLVATYYHVKHVHFFKPGVYDYDRLLSIRRVAHRTWRVCFRHPRSWKPLLGATLDKKWRCWSFEKIIGSDILKNKLRQLVKLHNVLGHRK